MRGSAYAALVTFGLTAVLGGQIGTAPVEGLRENTPRCHVLRGATVWVKPGQKIENGVILLRDGLIEKVGGPDLVPPPDAREWNVSGRTIYAGFIESASTLGKPDTVSAAHTHWSPLIRPERQASSFGAPSKDELDALRGLGFASAHVIPNNGIFRGQSSLFNLGATPSVLSGNVRQVLAFELSEKGYPASLMGVIALVRQTLYDARWYRDMGSYLRQHPEAERPEANAALEALAPVIEKSQPLLAAAKDELDYARLLALAREFELPNPAILGNGHEYRQAELLKNSGVTVIVPLDFPKAPPVEMPEAVLEISLESLEQWERAPANANALAERNIPICLTSYGLDAPKDNFWKRVREAVKAGLNPDAALGALTQQPASLLGVWNRLGSLEAGKIANLVVANGDLFTEEEAAIQAVWVDGVPFEMESARKQDLRGEWTLQWTGVEAAAKWTVKGKLGAPALKVGGKDFPIKTDGEQITIFPPAEFFSKGEGTARLTGYLNATDRGIRGTGTLPGGQLFTWSATIGPAKDEEKKEEDEEKPAPLPAFAKYPAGSFGIAEAPVRPKAILLRNATVWTCGPAGKLVNADVLIEDGKISQVGPGLASQVDALIINAEGKHVTPGLIDCHSHTAMSRGINEGTHAVTVEVRAGDVIDPTDIALYRELAGGLTTASVLHGSANPMGGQNQVIKLRWGSRTAEAMRFEGAKPGVKFALGENVKQSNWRASATGRYPQTRMGVEQIMKDTFLAARDYERERTEAAAKGQPHRRDLRLDAALEMLKGERIIHIHSYRQDEILMFVRLSQELGLTVGTFQHVLEGYKVADAIQQIGAGGSSFSDWWAYKFEVYDAIPYNGALLHQAGVVTSFNSDSNELATRLNTEAAKAVKYGGLSEEEALKFVTLNPAKQLRIEDRVGSLEPGKDADFVIWNGSPLSTFSRAEQTWIDGKKYFDLAEDAKLREEAISERERLIAKALPKRVSELEKKKEKEGDDKESEKPVLDWFAKIGKPTPCPSIERGLYHDGQSAHTCSGGKCCGR